MNFDQAHSDGQIRTDFLQSLSRRNSRQSPDNQTEPDEPMNFHWRRSLLVQGVNQFWNSNLPNAFQHRCPIVSINHLGVPGNLTDYRLAYHGQRICGESKPIERFSQIEKEVSEPFRHGVRESKTLIVLIGPQHRKMIVNAAECLEMASAKVVGTGLSGVALDLLHFGSHRALAEHLASVPQPESFAQEEQV